MPKEIAEGGERGLAVAYFHHICSPPSGWPI